MTTSIITYQAATELAFRNNLITNSVWDGPFFSCGCNRYGQWPQLAASCTLSAWQSESRSEFHTVYLTVSESRAGSVRVTASWTLSTWQWASRSELHAVYLTVSESQRVARRLPDSERVAASCTLSTWQWATRSELHAGYLTVSESPMFPCWHWFNASTALKCNLDVHTHAAIFCLGE